MTDTYHPERNITPSFLQKSRQWIRDSGEVLVVLRYLRAAGAKDFVLCRSPEEFDAIVARVPVGCDIEVFRDPQLPLRGVVTAEFIHSALTAMPDGTEYLLITRENRSGGLLAAKYDMGETHAELWETLDGFLDKEVALGLCPEFWREDHAGLISASKGGIDGPR